MQPLAEADIIRVWETGAGQHPIDQALTMLGAALPEQSRRELALLSIGQRDGYLLTLRERLFGSHLQALVTCPVCTERVELHLTTTDIRVIPERDGPLHPLAIDMEAGTLQFRAPNSIDLAAIVDCADAQQARHLLAQRCVLTLQQDDAVMSLDALPETAIEQLATRLSACDPQAEVLLNLTCPTCDHSWQIHFDIVSFLWKEVSAYARRLLREVHTLARFYGWREDDILSLSPTRRRLYLEMTRP